MIEKPNLDTFLNSIVGKANNLFGQDTEKYAKGYRYGQGAALRVVRPRTTDEVSQILKFCNKHNIKIVPQGGNTGLVGASTPDNSGEQIVLSTDLLNKDIFQLNNTQKTIRIGAGWVLDALNEKLSGHNLMLPIDIGSSGTCNIGGLIATNAAGTRSGRYGNAKSRVMELTVVLASGEVKKVSQANSPATSNQQPATPIQDNSHLDLTNPFIGSQGWLGIITEAVIQLETLAKKAESVILVPRDIMAINTIRAKFASAFGDGFTAFEGMSDLALQLVAKHIPSTKYLFANEDIAHNYALLLEVSSNDPHEDLEEKLLDIMGELLESGDVVTGLLGKAEIYWHNRHHISEALAKAGHVIATDIAVGNPDELGKFREEMIAELAAKYPHLLIVPFGHEMIGALHFNLVWPKEKPLTAHDKRDIQSLIYDKVIHKYHGTYSAEHGVGPHNQWAYDKYTPKEIKAAAHALKEKYDPNGILNPNIHYR
jgi:FAD/FMN-containing dehydrogenase